MSLLSGLTNAAQRKLKPEPDLDGVNIPDFIDFVETAEGRFYLSDEGFWEPVEKDDGELDFLERKEVLEMCPEKGEIDSLSSLKIPAGVDVIGTGAFKDAISLEEIVIPEGVMMLQAEAFRGCHNLKAVKLPSTLECIDDRAFESCSSLKTLRIPNDVEVIGREAFRDCDSLERVVIGDGVRVVEEGAFKGCTALRSVRFGMGILTIEQYAFLGCRELRWIFFHPSGNLQHLASSSFEGTRSVRKLKLPKRYRQHPPYGELPQAFLHSRIYFYTRH